MGEQKDSERIARPAPPSEACASDSAPQAVTKSLQDFGSPFSRDRLRAVGIVEAEHGCLDEGARGAEGRGVRRVSLDLRRPPFVALDDQAVGAPAERHRRRVVAGDSRERRPRARRQTGRSLRPGAGTPRAPASDSDAPRSIIMSRRRDPVGKLRGALLQELPLERGAEFGAILELRETSPVRSTHRWHPEQSVGGLTGRAPPSCAASAWASRGGVHFMLVTSETGTPVGTGIAVAVEAPAHTERRHLRDRLPSRRCGRGR